MTDEVSLQPGGQVEIAGIRVACWWSDTPNVVRVLNGAAEWELVALFALVPVGDWIQLPGFPGIEIRGHHPALTGFEWQLRATIPTDIDPI